MSDDREVEIKFKTDVSGLRLAAASPLLACDAPETSSQTMRSVYFDTAAGDLRKRRFALRIRETGGGDLQMGLKWTPMSQELFSRGEVEIRALNMQPDISLFDGNIGAEIERAIEDRPLEPQFETVIKRRVRNIKIGRSEVEVAFDEGAVIAGDRRLPICEIELELKSGEEVELYELAIRLVETLPLSLDFMSKAERGFMLAFEEHPQPIKASAPCYSADATLNEAIAAIIVSAITQFTANWPALREAQHPGSIHQMRVALRQLRAALTMFKQALPCPEFDIFRAESKRIASAFGPARDFDIFRDLVTNGPRAHYPHETSFEPLLAALEAQRLTGYSQALKIVNEPATALFVLRIQECLERQSWRRALSEEERPRLKEPARVFAIEVMERLHKRALKSGKGLIDLPDAERHRVRIALKNVRYAAEFFGELFGSEAVQSYVHAVARLQDLLGAHNDAVSCERLLNEIEGTAGAQSAKALGIVLGWYGRETDLPDTKLLKSWKAFKRTKIFWR